LQVLDEGRLTDNKGRLADFRNTIIIMTSNMGAHIIQDKLEGLDMKKRLEVVQETKVEVLGMLKQTVRPEFINRIDEIIMFTPLDKEEVNQIVKIQINGLVKMLAEKGIAFKATEPAIENLATIGFDPQYGARPIKRVIQREVLNKLSKEILAGKITAESSIELDYQNGTFVFKNK